MAKTESAYSPGLNMDFHTLGVVFLAISTTIGAINFVVTFFKLRAPGMSENRVPIILWGMRSWSVMIVFAAPTTTTSFHPHLSDFRFVRTSCDSAHRWPRCSMEGSGTGETGACRAISGARS